MRHQLPARNLRDMFIIEFIRFVTRTWQGRRETEFPSGSSCETLGHEHPGGPERR